MCETSVPEHWSHGGNDTVRGLYYIVTNLWLSSPQVKLGRNRQEAAVSDWIMLTSLIRWDNDSCWPTCHYLYGQWGMIWLGLLELMSQRPGFHPIVCVWALGLQKDECSHSQLSVLCTHQSAWVYDDGVSSIRTFKSPWNQSLVFNDYWCTTVCK